MRERIANYLYEKIGYFCKGHSRWYYETDLILKSPHPIMTLKKELSWIAMNVVSSHNIHING